MGFINDDVNNVNGTTSTTDACLFHALYDVITAAFEYFTAFSGTFISVFFQMVLLLPPSQHPTSFSNRRQTFLLTYFSCRVGSPVCGPSSIYFSMISPPDAVLVAAFSRLTTVIGVVTILLAALSSALVLFSSGRTSKEYRYCLLAIVVRATNICAGYI